MASDIGSIQPNPYLFNIENRRKRKARLAHEIGAGAPCLKCGIKCAGFQLHFWRKICQNCRCGKDDHDIDEEDEDIGKIVIGKLFDRPIRTKEEELLYSVGTDLEMVNETTGKKEKLKFDWVPPGVANNVAKRYMEMLPPEKRPVAGTEAAKQRRRQLEQQVPLYDMDESERCENLPPEELHNFQKYLQDIRTRVAGQAQVREISVAGQARVQEIIPPAPLNRIEPPPHLGTNDINAINNNFVHHNQMRDSLDRSRAEERGLHSLPNLATSFGAMQVNQSGATPYQPNKMQLLEQPSLAIPCCSIQTSPPKGFRSVSPSVPKRNELNASTTKPNLNLVQPSLKHLTPPQPYVAKSYEQNIVPEQFSSNLIKSPVKDPLNQDPQFHHHQPTDLFGNLSDQTSNFEGSHLPNMVGMEGRRIVTSQAVQAPYAPQREMIIGPGTFAQESDVNVLFPHESQILGGQKMKVIQYPVDDTLGTLCEFACQFCHGSMIPGDVAVICERAGPGKYWHPQCFVCVTCKELLADLIYFYKDGQIFCGRHYTQAADIPRCKACDELIFGESWTRADSFDWHLHHYCCFVCDTRLAGMKYVPDEKGFPHCMSCHMSFKAKMCETCEEKISPNETRAGYRGYFYHATPRCFSCFNCNVSMIGRKFKMAKNWIFCSQECIDSAFQLIANNPNPKEMLH